MVFVMVDFFSEKNFLYFVLVWFALVFVVMWFIGGACTDFFSGGTCFSKNSISFLSNIPIVQLFLPFHAWVSAMYWFAPVAGFILGFLALKWYAEYYDSKFSFSLWIVPLLLIALLLGYYINLSFYYGESASMATARTNGQAKYSLYFCFGEVSAGECNSVATKLNQDSIKQAQTAQTDTVPQVIPVAFWPELKESIFLTFMLGTIAAWVPLFLRNFFNEKKE
jgi:hypothetical protein